MISGRQLSCGVCSLFVVTGLSGFSETCNSISINIFSFASLYCCFCQHIYLFDAELCSGIIDCNKLLSALHSRAGGGLCAEIVHAPNLLLKRLPISLL